MAKSVSQYLSTPLKGGSTDPDMEAAQYLVQLSGEENNEENDCSNSNNNYDSKSKNENKSEEEKDNKQNDAYSSSSNKEEIFGRETAVFQQKKRRYRSIASIYGRTKPLEVTHPKKTRLRC